MKFSKEKKIQLKSNTIVKLIFLVVIFFILGIWTEKYNLFKKPQLFFTKIYENLYSKIVSRAYDIDTIVIDINYKNFEKIKNSRDIALKNEYLRPNDVKWSSGNIVYKNQKNKIRIRLKGMLGDHWKHPYKWSFYVKIDDDNPSIFNLRRFTLQPPHTLNYLQEWLFMMALKKEGLIYHRTRFVELIVNGNKYGLYTLQERSMKELIENNKRREGPVINFSNHERLNEHINFDKIGANKINDYFWRSEIRPIQFKKSQKGTVQEKYLNKAISLLELFRSKKLSVNEVFDLDQFAKLMAIRAVFGSTEFDVDDMKFYYNPISNLLEPISKEIHSEADRFVSGFNPWVFKSDNLRYPWQKAFLDLLYNDQIFYEKYLFELNNYSNKKFIANIIDDNKVEFEKLKKVLKLNFPSKEFYRNQDFEKVSSFIQGTLKPIQKPYFNLLNKFNNNLELRVTNTQILPIEIIGINIDNDYLELNPINFVKGFDTNQKQFQKIIKIDCLSLKCTEENLNKIEIRYRVFGQKKEYSNTIKLWNNDFKIENFNNKKNEISLILDKYKFIQKNKNELIINDQEWEITERVIIPKDHKLIIKNSSIKFSDGGQLISFSPIFVEGEKQNPVKITSDTIKNGNGILVINTNEESYLNNVVFKNLSAPNLISGVGLLGSVNFYEADVKILNSSFYKNLAGDDYINIIRSKFYIENSYFEETLSDSIDIDFSDGSIINSKFFMSKNDAIDFSGSNVKLEKIYIHGSGDKGISVGEGSTLNGQDIIIENSKIGIASKDASDVYLDNVTINNVDIGLAAYIKKIEYGSPQIKASNIQLENYKHDYISDLRSQIIIDDKKIKNTDCKENMEICSF